MDRAGGSPVWVAALSLATALGLVLASAPVRAQAPEGGEARGPGDGDGGRDDEEDDPFSFAVQAWFHLGLSGTADFRVNGEASILDESIDNTLGFGLLGEIRVLKEFLGLGLAFQWFQKQHEDDNTGQRWSAWDLGAHARLRVPLLFLNLFVRVPFGLSVATLPGAALGPGSDDATAVGWHASTLFGVEWHFLKILAAYVEVGPTWRHLPFNDLEATVGSVSTEQDIEVWTRDLTLNFGLTFTF